MERFQGIIGPIVTPFEADGCIANDLWSAHARWVLAEGAHYLAPFGTTGEALSVSTAKRMSGLESLIDAGISPSALMPGTGLTSVDDTAELTRHAIDLGVAAVMVLPSFFYLAAGDEGQYRYFSELIHKVNDGGLKICLYNIPQNSGVPISPSLAARLNAEFPENFVAYKDSTGDWNNTLSVIHAAPKMAVFPGTEALLVKALGRGGAGVISATVNLNAGAMRDVFDGAMNGQNTVGAEDGIDRFRTIIQSAGLIPALKSVLAIKYDDARWFNLKPPLQNGSKELGLKILEELGPLGKHIVRTDP